MQKVNKSFQHLYFENPYDVHPVIENCPSFFPFTEPSTEVDLLMTDKDGKESWVEMGGCGMVDPNVFDTVGIDNEKYTGWAFGCGIERLAMRKYSIPDIRLLFENDLRFLKQF
jgi:phenylalanyl-tRNA synthetase alpha chain